MPAARHAHLRRLVAVMAPFAAVAMLAMPHAAADAPPYTDPASVGHLTLCDTTGHSITHGNIHTKPFVWRAVGSTAGNGPYRSEPGRTAALFGYQPQQGLPPDQWNGEYLTESAKYSNAALPMAGATAADPSLADYLSDYPIKWDGLVQLRMFLDAPLQPTRTDTYNSATIKISGDQWTLLDGGFEPVQLRYRIVGRVGPAVGARPRDAGCERDDRRADQARGQDLRSERIRHRAGIHLRGRKPGWQRRPGREFEVVVVDRVNAAVGRPRCGCRGRHRHRRVVAVR